MSEHGTNSVIRKITQGVAKIKLGKEDLITLGNLNAKRDWGYAKDYVDGMWRMLQAEKPETYVLSTGREQSVRDFVEMSCKAVDINIRWKGEGVDEVGIDSSSNKEIININPKFYRPAEVDNLIGNAQKVKQDLGWEAKTSLEDLCKMMIEEDIRRVKSGISF